MMLSQDSKVRNSIKITIGERRRRGRPPHGTTVHHPTNPSSIRTAIDHLAYKYNLIHESNGRPRDAEIVRVLILSELLKNEPVELRVAAALYSNSILDLSGYLSNMLYVLRDAVWVATLRHSKHEINDDRPSVRTKTRLKSSSRKADNAQPNREQVYLVLDDRLREIIRDQIGEYKDYEFVRLLLESAISRDDSVDVVAAYAKIIERMRDKIRAIVVVEKDAILAAIGKSKSK